MSTNWLRQPFFYWVVFTWWPVGKRWAENGGCCLLWFWFLSGAECAVWFWIVVRSYLRSTGGFRLCWYFFWQSIFLCFIKNVCQVSRYRTSLKPIQKSIKYESPEVPKVTFRDYKQSPRSRASPDFGSSPIQRKAELEKRLCLLKYFETISKHFKSF